MKDFPSLRHIADAESEGKAVAAIDFIYGEKRAIQHRLADRGIGAGAGEKETQPMSTLHAHPFRLLKNKKPTGLRPGASSPFTSDLRYSINKGLRHLRKPSIVAQAKVLHRRIFASRAGRLPVRIAAVDGNPAPTCRRRHGKY